MPELFLKRSLHMMLRLVADVLPHTLDAGLAYGKRAVTGLPVELCAGIVFRLEGGAKRWWVG